MLIDGAFQKKLCCSLVELGSEKEINRLGHNAVEIFLLTYRFRIRLAQSPTDAHGALASAKEECQYRQNLSCPAVYCGVIVQDTALLAIIPSMWRRISGYAAN